MAMMLRRNDLLLQTGVAVALSFLVYGISSISFFIALPVLLFDGPISAIIIEFIASRKPGADGRIEARSWRPVFITAGAVIVLASGLTLWRDLSFPESFAYALLGVTSLGAILGIATEGADEW
jgi:hypothetical protein